LHDAATTGLAWLAFVIWLYLIFGRGRFWQVWKWTYLGTSSGVGETRARVVAVVPARNEADVIAESVGSLLAQDFSGWLHVVVVDDSSSDGTGDIARQSGVTVAPGKPLERGWTGKLWALQQGVALAETLEPDYLLFTDADIRHGKRGLAQLVALAEERHLDMASYMVKLQCRTVPEKLLIPPFVFFFLMLYPPKWGTGAAGGCLLIRPAMLRAIGGLQAIRGEIIDDCSLAAAVRRQGGRVWLGLTPESESIRPYTTFGEILRMISRSAFRQLDHSLWMLLAAVVGLTVTYLAPVGLLFSGDTRVTGIALVTYVIMCAVYWPMIRFYRLPVWWCALLPMAASFYLGATVHSAVQYWRGKGGVWKGRVQDH
jgi:hopene-associated glycosyltransferase HpnB